MDDDEGEPDISFESCMLMEVTELNPSTPADQSDSSTSTRPSSTLPVASRRLTSKSYSIRTRSSSKHKSHDHHSSTSTSEHSSGGGAHAKHHHHFHHHHEAASNRESRSGGNAAGGADDDDQKTVTVVYARNDKFVSTQDICASCGSFGSSDVEKKLISCVQCGNCYHIFCAHPSPQYALPVSDELQPKVNPVVSKWGWRCLECTVCEGCGEPHDEARLILCEDCDISYHIYCLKPPLKEVPLEAWRCDRCAHCQFCGSRQVSCKINSKTKAGENYTACKRCISLFVCAYCKKNYTEGTPLLHCSTCRQWMHQECFDETYKSLAFDELHKLVDAALAVAGDDKGLVCGQCIRSNKRARSISGDLVGNGFSLNNAVDDESRVVVKSAKTEDQQVSHGPDVTVKKESMDVLLDADEEAHETENKRKNQDETIWPLILSREPRDLLSHDGMFLTERGYVMFKERERYLYNVTHGIQVSGVGGGRGGKAARGRRKRGAGPPFFGAPSLQSGPPGSIGEHRGSDASSVSSGGGLSGKRGRGVGGRGSRGPRKNCKVGVGGFSARLWSNKTRGRLARLSASDVVTANGSPMRGGHTSHNPASSLSSAAAAAGGGGGGGSNDDFLLAFASKDSQGDVFIDINNAETQPRGKQSSRASIQGLRHQYPTFIVDAFFTAPKQRVTTSTAIDNEFHDGDSSSQNAELVRAGAVDDSVFLDDDAVLKTSNKPRLALEIPANDVAGDDAVQSGRETPPADQQRQVTADNDDLPGRSRASRSFFHPPTLVQDVSSQQADLLREFWSSTSSRAESRLVAMRAKAASAVEMDNIADNYASAAQTTPTPEVQLRPESSATENKLDPQDDLAMMDAASAGGGPTGGAGSSFVGGGGGGGADHTDADANLHGMMLPDDLDDLGLDEDDLMALFDSNVHEFAEGLEGVDIESLNVEAALAAAPTTSSSAASGMLQPQQQQRCGQSSTAGGEHQQQVKREQRMSSIGDEKPPQIIVKHEGSDERHRQQHEQQQGESSSQASTGANADDTLESLMNQFDEQVIQTALGGRNNSELSNLVELSGSDADDLFKNLCALEEAPAGGGGGSQQSGHTSVFGGGRSVAATALIPPPQLGMNPPGVGIGGMQPPVLASSPATALLESSSSSLMLPTSMPTISGAQQLAYQQQQQHSMQYSMQNQQSHSHMANSTERMHQQQFQVVQQRTTSMINSGLSQGPSHLGHQQQFGHQKMDQSQGEMMQQQQQMRMNIQQPQQQFSDEFGNVSSQYSSLHMQQQQNAVGGNVVRTIMTSGGPVESSLAGHQLTDQSPVMVMPPMYAHPSHAPPHQPSFALQPSQSAMQGHIMHAGVPADQLRMHQSTNPDIRMGQSSAAVQQQELASPVPGAPAEQPSSSQQTAAEPGYQQKQLYKWGIDEKRGDKAVCGPVLWSNVCHPEWKTEHPNWNDRNKLIMKMWKELQDKDVKDEFVKRARKNRSDEKAAEKQAEKQKGKAAKKQAASKSSKRAAGDDEDDEDAEDDKTEKNDADRTSDDESGSTSKAASTFANSQIATPAPPPNFGTPIERATAVPGANALMSATQPQHHVAGPNPQHIQQQLMTPIPPQQSPSHHPSMSPYSQKSTTPQSFTYPPPSVSSTNSSGIDSQQQLMRYPSGMIVQSSMDGLSGGMPPSGMMVRTPSGYHISPRFGPSQQQQLGSVGEREISFDLQQQQGTPRHMLSEGYQSGPPTPYGSVPMNPHSSSQQFPQQMQRYARGPAPPPVGVPYTVSPQQIHQQQQLRMVQQQQQLRYGNMQQPPNAQFQASQQQQQQSPRQSAMMAVRPGAEPGVMPQQHMGSPEFNMVRGGPYAQQSRLAYAAGPPQQMQMQTQQQYVQPQQYITSRTRDGMIVQHAIRPGDLVNHPQPRWTGQQQPQQYMQQMQDPNLVYYRAPQQQQQQQWQYSGGDPAQGMRPRVPQQMGMPPHNQFTQQPQQTRMQQQSPMPQGVYGQVRVAYGPPPPSPSGQGAPPQMQVQYSAAQAVGGVGPRGSPGSFMSQQVGQLPPGTRYISPQQAQIMQQQQQQQRAGIAAPAQYYPAVSASMQHQSSQSPQPMGAPQHHMQQLQQRANFNVAATLSPPPMSQPPLPPSGTATAQHTAASARDATPSSQTSQPLSTASVPATTAPAATSPPPPPPEVAQKLAEMDKMSEDLVAWGADIEAARKEKKALASSARKRHQKEEQLSEEDTLRLDVLKKKVQSLQKRIEGKRKKFKVANQTLPPEYQKQLPQSASTSKAAAAAAAKEAAAATTSGEGSATQEQSSDAAGPATSPASSSATATAAAGVVIPQHPSTSPTVNLAADVVVYQQLQNSQSGRLRQVNLAPQQIPGMMRLPGTPGSGGGLMLVSAPGGCVPRGSGTSPSPFGLQPVTSIPSPRPPSGSFRVPMQPPQGMSMPLPQMSNQMPPFSPNNASMMQQQQRGPPPPYHQQQQLQMLNRPLGQSQQFVSMPGGPYGGLMPRMIDSQQQQQHHLGAQHSGGVMSTVMRQAGFAPDQQLAFAPICSTIASCMPLGGNAGGLIVTNMQGGGNMIMTSSAMSMQTMPGTSMMTSGGREKNPMLKQLLEQSAATQAAAAAAAAAANGAETKLSTPAVMNETVSTGDASATRPSLKRKASASLSVSSATATSDADTQMSAERPQSGAVAVSIESLQRQLSRTALPLQEPSMLTALNQRTQLGACRPEALFDLKNSALFNTVLEKTAINEISGSVSSESDLPVKTEDGIVDTKSPVAEDNKIQSQLVDAAKQFEENCVYALLSNYENVAGASADSSKKRSRNKAYSSLLPPDSKDVPSIVLGDDISLSGAYVSSIGTNSTQAQMQIDQSVQQRRAEKLFGSFGSAGGVGSEQIGASENSTSIEPLCHRQLPFAAIMCEKLLRKTTVTASGNFEITAAAGASKVSSAAGGNRRHRGSIDKRSTSVSNAAAIMVKVEDDETGAASGIKNIDEAGSLLGPKAEAVAVVMDSDSAMASTDAVDVALSEAAVVASEDAMTGSPNLGEVDQAAPKVAATVTKKCSPYADESDTRMTVPETMLHSPVAFFGGSTSIVPVEPTPINKFYGIADLQFDAQALDPYGELREPSGSGVFDRRRKQSIGQKASESAASHNGKPDNADEPNEPFMSNFPAPEPSADPARTRIRLVITRESSTRLDFVLENLAAVLDADKLWFKSLQVNKRFDMRTFLAPFAVNYAVLTNNVPLGQNSLVDGPSQSENNNRPDYSVCAECGSVCLNPVVLAKCSPSSSRQLPDEVMALVSPPPSTQPSMGGGGGISDGGNNNFFDDELPNNLDHHQHLQNNLSRSSSIESSSVQQRHQPSSSSSFQQQQQQQLQDNVFCSSSCFVRYNSIAHGKGADFDLNGLTTMSDDVPAVPGDMKSSADDDEPNSLLAFDATDAQKITLGRVRSSTSLVATNEDLVDDNEPDLFAIVEQKNSQLLHDVLLKARRQLPFSARKHAQVLIKFTTRDLRALKRRLQAYRADTFEHDPHGALLYDVGLRADRHLHIHSEENVADVVIDRRTCVLCGGVGDADPQKAGRLLYYEPDAWVHSNCALWSNDVYETVAGSLMAVVKAVTTSAKRLCVSCSRPSASLQCLYPKCGRTYHFPCALHEKCSFFEDKSFMCPPHWLVLSQFKMMIGQIRASTGVTEDIITTSEIIGHLAAGNAAGGVGGVGGIGSGAANSSAMNAAVSAVQTAVAAYTAAALATAGNADNGKGIKPSTHQTPPIDASAAVQQIEALMREYQYEEQQFLQLMAHVNQLEHFACFRRLHVLHKESSHIDRILAPEYDGLCTFRTGSLLLHKIGTLMPDQVANFHTANCIYPVGYLASRIYWSTRYFNRRCRYICYIRVFVNEDNGFVEEGPDFVVEIIEPPFPNSFIVGESTQAVCGKIFERILATRYSSLSMPASSSSTPFAKFFNKIANGDEFFGLREPHIVRLIENLPNVLEHAVNYKTRTPPSKRGQVDVPVAQNRYNAMRYCAYVAPDMRHIMRNNALQLTSASPIGAVAVAANSLANNSGKPRSAWARAQAPVRSLSCAEAVDRSSGHHHHHRGGHHRASGMPHGLSSASSADLVSLNQGTGSSSGGAAGEVDVPAYFTKQSSQAKSSQYRKLKTDWQKNIYLGRSKISGLGLFAGRDIEKNTMVIEYIGQIIRHEVANRRERNYTKQQRQDLYMFRLDDNWVIDATSLGGAARYINHSCSPNCATEVVQVAPDVKKIVISSTRKILKDEELTYDYKFDVEEDDGKKIPCMCGSTACRGWMN